MSILDINGQNYTIIHWLNILINNRIFDSSTPLEREAKRYITQEFHVDTDNADIIKGYRADDSYFSYAKDFISGIISYEQLCKALMLGNLGNRYALRARKHLNQSDLQVIRRLIIMNGILRKWQEICMQEMVIRQWKKRIIEKGIIYY